MNGCTGSADKQVPTIGDLSLDGGMLCRGAECAATVWPQQVPLERCGRMQWRVRA